MPTRSREKELEYDLQSSPKWKRGRTGMNGRGKYLTGKEGNGLDRLIRDSFGRNIR